jgi:hypothetical protein
MLAVWVVDVDPQPAKVTAPLEIELGTDKNQSKFQYSVEIKRIIGSLTWQGDWANQGVVHQWSGQTEHGNIIGSNTANISGMDDRLSDSTELLSGLNSGQVPFAGQNFQTSNCGRFGDAMSSGQHPVGAQH